MNSRGNVPITLLVLGIFGVCGLALITFYVSDLQISNSFVGVDKVHVMNSVLNEHKYYLDKGMDSGDVEKVFSDVEGLKIIGEGGRKYFYLEKKQSKFNFLKFGFEEELLFSIKYPVPS